MQKCEIIRAHGCSPVNLLHIFITPFPKNTCGRLLLAIQTQHKVQDILSIKRS